MGTGDQGNDKELTRLVNNDNNNGNNKEGSINYTDVLKGICLVLIWISAVTVSDTCCQLLERVIPDFSAQHIQARDHCTVHDYGIGLQEDIASDTCVSDTGCLGSFIGKFGLCSI